MCDGIALLLLDRGLECKWGCRFPHGGPITAPCAYASLHRQSMPILASHHRHPFCTCVQIKSGADGSLSTPTRKAFARLLEACGLDADDLAADAGPRRQSFAGGCSHVYRWLHVRVRVPACMGSHCLPLESGS